MALGQTKSFIADMTIFQRLFFKQAKFQNKGEFEKKPKTLSIQSLSGPFPKLFGSCIFFIRQCTRDLLGKGTRTSGIPAVVQYQ